MFQGVESAGGTERTENRKTEEIEGTEAEGPESKETEGIESTKTEGPENRKTEETEGTEAVSHREHRGQRVI
jgi:hypothetical protein